MKANKALKRLTKIEDLISDVTERYSEGAPAIRKALQDAMTDVAVAKEAETAPRQSARAIQRAACAASPPPVKTGMVTGVPTLDGQL